MPLPEDNPAPLFKVKVSVLHFNEGDVVTADQLKGCDVPWLLERGTIVPCTMGGIPLMADGAPVTVESLLQDCEGAAERIEELEGSLTRERRAHESTRIELAQAREAVTKAEAERDDATARLKDAEAANAAALAEVTKLRDENAALSLELESSDPPATEDPPATSKKKK